MTDNASPKPKDPPRRFWPLVGLFLTLAILLYLAASWVQVNGRPAAGTSRLQMQGGWILVRPMWLYPVTLLLGIIATVAVIVYRFASRLPSRASWRQLVRVQAEFTRHELDILCACRGRGRQCPKAICEATSKHLDAAERAADPDECRKLSGMDQLIDVWTGASMRLPSATSTQLKWRWCRCFPRKSCGRGYRRFSPASRNARQRIHESVRP
jgi:hypothetical protein